MLLRRARHLLELQDRPQGDCFRVLNSRNLSISMIPTIGTVATEIIVDPARTATNRRPPKRLAEKTANNSSGDRSNRARNQ